VCVARLGWRNKRRSHLEVTKRLFHFSYSQHQSRSEPLLHALRDGDAFAEIAAVLLKEGYDYNGLIFNFSAPDPEVKRPALGASDLVVLTTRPPHRHRIKINKKDYLASGEELERSILDAVDRHFAAHSRSLVTLSSEMAAKLKKPDRGEIEFRQRHHTPDQQSHHAPYLRHRNPYIKKQKQGKWRKPKKETLTAAFCLYTNLWADGPLFLNAFGMDGPTTLIWCYLLRTRFSALLKPHRLVMAELTTDPFPRKPQSLSFADKWRVEILLNQELQQNSQVRPAEGVD
jgi:hypothetical protein